MRLLHTNVRAAAAIVCALIFSVAGTAPRAAAADDPAVLAADWDFAQAAAKSDSAALGKLLDSDFIWIDVNGNVSDLYRVHCSVPMITPSSEDSPLVQSPA